MKLNADIIYMELSVFTPLECYGPRYRALQLKPPVFWHGEQAMEPNRIYLIRADRFPENVQIGKGTLIICVGGNPPKLFRDGKQTVFVVPSSLDIFQVSNLLHQIFEKYECWEAEMQQILDAGADLQQLVDCCGPYLHAPILFQDKDLRALAYSQEMESLPELSVYRPEKNNLPNIWAVTEYFKKHGTSNIERRDTFSVEIEDNVTLIAKNFFDRGTFVGCLSTYIIRTDRERISVELIQYFFEFAAKFFQKASLRITGFNQILKQSLFDLINCYPLDSIRQRPLHASTDHYYCLKLQPCAQLQKVPVEYCCAQLENAFSGCIAFEYESDIIAFLNITQCGFDSSDIAERLRKSLGFLDMRIGISNEFSDLLQTRLFFRQACVALEIGCVICPDQKTFFFADYLLPYMLLQSTGEFPLDFLLSEFFSPLMEHDKDSGVSYMDTLYSYLRNNLNALQTADEMYLHRSTLNARLLKIENLLPQFTQDKKKCLMYHILLAARALPRFCRKGQGEIFSWQQ